jgi:two-component system LytT family sensor kinase
MLLMAIVALELVRQALGVQFGADRIFYFEAASPWMIALVVLATVLAVATPVKIWNSARIEHRLQEQGQLLLAAKIEALKSQINPHFLFNTLTSISSLIRSQPDTARTLIIKLAAMLRRLLHSHQQFVTLSDELASIDEYLDIEIIRFGPKLQVRREIAPDTREVIVPSMILQPLVENSIKHGFARKVGPGVITIRSRRENGRAVIEVEDDGMGFVLARLDEPMASGIGLANVRERLAVIYGDQQRFALTSEPGRGTTARIEVPELAAAQPVTA